MPTMFRFTWIICGISGRYTGETQQDQVIEPLTGNTAPIVAVSLSEFRGSSTDAAPNFKLRRAFAPDPHLCNEFHRRHVMTTSG